MDTYADDLATLVDTLNPTDAIHVGHSTSGGEVARYIGRHGTRRVAKAVPIGAIPPLMLQTTANPGGLPMEADQRGQDSSVLRANDLLDAHGLLVGTLPHRAAKCTRPATAAAPS